MKTLVKRAYPRVSINLGATKENPGRTKQSFRDECDINLIVPQANKTGLLTHITASGGRYEDLSNAPDYQTALNLVISADAAFQELPAGIRKTFDNDPETFLSFMDDPENAEKCIEMGLMAKPDTPGEKNPPGEPAAAGETKSDKKDSDKGAEAQ